MKKIKPHGQFDVSSPDEVAECMAGVGYDSPLYRRLWELVELVPNDTSEVPDNFGCRCLALVWSKLTRDQQIELNRLATAADAVEEAEMARIRAERAGR